MIRPRPWIFSQAALMALFLSSGSAYAEFLTPAVLPNPPVPHIPPVTTSSLILNSASPHAPAPAPATSGDPCRTYISISQLFPTLHRLEQVLVLPIHLASISEGSQLTARVFPQPRSSPVGQGTESNARSPENETIRVRAIAGGDVSYYHVSITGPDGRPAVRAAGGTQTEGIYGGRAEVPALGVSLLGNVDPQARRVSSGLRYHILEVPVPGGGLVRGLVEQNSRVADGRFGLGYSVGAGTGAEVHLPTPDGQEMRFSLVGGPSLTNRAHSTVGVAPTVFGTFELLW